MSALLAFYKEHGRSASLAEKAGLCITAEELAELKAGAESAASIGARDHLTPEERAAFTRRAAELAKGKRHGQF